MEHDEPTLWLDSVTIHNGKTILPPIPFDQSGFHWRAGTTRVERACGSAGQMASAVVDDEVVARGLVSTVEVSPTGDAAVIHVVPPAGGEHDERCFETAADRRHVTV